MTCLSKMKKFLLLMVSVFTLGVAQAQQQPTVEQLATQMQFIVGVDFGGFEYSAIYGDNDTLVMEMLMTDPTMVMAVESATPEQLAQLSTILNKSFTQNPQTVAQMKLSKINFRIILKTANKVVFDETIKYYNL